MFTQFVKCYYFAYVYRIFQKLNMDDEEQLIIPLNQEAMPALEDVTDDEAEFPTEQNRQGEENFGDHPMFQNPDPNYDDDENMEMRETNQGDPAPVAASNKEPNEDVLPETVLHADDQPQGARIPDLQSQVHRERVRRSVPQDPNSRPLQRARKTTQPYDEGLRDQVIFSDIFQEISLSTLESENAMENANINFSFIDLQLLRLITSKDTSANVYSRRKSETRSAHKFTRLLLARVLSEKYQEDNARLVYIMEARNMNSNLWNKNVNHRDNGAISIGSVFRISCPLPIEKYMSNDIPMLTTHLPAILLKLPDSFIPIRMNEQIESSTSLAFIHNGAKIDVNYTAPLKTSCSGKLCDRQRVSDWNGSKGCGCYGMNSNSSSLVLSHSIKIRTSMGVFTCNEFSSLKFSSLYLKKDIPGSVKLFMLQNTSEFMNMLLCQLDCIKFINDNGGFTIVGWYKRGEINDQSMLTSSMPNSNFNNSNEDNNHTRVDAAEVSYHIVQIIPTNRNLLDKGHRLEVELHDKKYDVASIENYTLR